MIFKDAKMKEWLRQLTEFDFFNAAKNTKLDIEQLIQFLARDLHSKVVILLSEIVTKKICLDVISHLVKEGSLKIMQDRVIVKRFLVEVLQKTRISIDHCNEQRTDFARREEGMKIDKECQFIAYSHCQAMITLSYYLKMLSELYHREPTEASISKSIIELISIDILHTYSFPDSIF